MSCRQPSGKREVFSGDIFGMDDIIGIIESGVGRWIFLDVWKGLERVSFRRRFLVCISILLCIWCAVQNRSRYVQNNSIAKTLE